MCAGALTVLVTRMLGEMSDADGNRVDEATIGLVQGLLTALKDKIDATA